MSEIRELPVSTLTRPNNAAIDGTILAGMPNFSSIEDLASLIETAQEYLTAHPKGKKADNIRQILSELDRTHAAADHHDSGHQCNDRHIIRKGII